MALTHTYTRTLLHPRHLVLELPDARNTYSMARGPEGSGTARLVHEVATPGQAPTRKEHTYLLVSRSDIAVPPEAQDKDKREGIVSTAVTVAFPLDSTGHALARADVMSFAFLPIAPSGLRFLVQVRAVCV